MRCSDAASSIAGSTAHLAPIVVASRSVLVGVARRGLDRSEALPRGSRLNPTGITPNAESGRVRSTADLVAHGAVAASTTG
jgi:hypothetical protein